MIITIDGDTAAGKGTVAKQIAKKHSMYYLGSGLVFRAFGYLNGIGQANNAKEFYDKKDDITFDWDGDVSTVIYKESNITQILESDEVARRTAILAADGSNMLQMNSLVREIGVSHLNTGLICEGRTTGSGIFPDADFKFFITASTEVRALRRYEDFLRQGQKISLQEVYANLKERDNRDRTRSTFPLLAPEGSRTIDTSNLSIMESVETVEHAILSHIPREGTLNLNHINKK